MPREHTGHGKHPFPTMQETTLHMYTPDGQYRNQTYHVLCSQRWRSSLQSAKTRLGVDCESDHEFLIGRFRLKLKKVRKTTRPYRYELNQIPYDYTVDVTNRFRGLDVVDEVLEEPGTEVHSIVQQAVIKTISKKKGCKMAKILSEEALKITEEKRKGKIYPTECRVQEKSKER